MFCIKIWEQERGRKFRAQNRFATAEKHVFQRVLKHFHNGKTAIVEYVANFLSQNELQLLENEVLDYNERKLFQHDEQKVKDRINVLRRKTLHFGDKTVIMFMTGPTTRRNPGLQQ